MNLLRRIISPKGRLIFLCLAVILLAAGAQKVSAAEQTRYLIKVNRACNTITIYEKDRNGQYTVPVKAMACSVGKNGKTITGTYQTKEKYRWKALMGDVWGQYATRIFRGILFHSVYYYENGNSAALATREFNKLGTAASHGCVRLAVGDAKWIYDNCSYGTTVIIYDDQKNPGPLGKPETVKLPATVKWDPTDPNPDNPYHKNFPVLTGVKDFKTPWGKTVDLLKGITAKSSLGENITALIQTQGSVDCYTPGDYSITYSVTDGLSRTETKTATITVEECLAEPEIRGVKDHLVTGDVEINDAFARNGVEIFRGDQRLEDQLLKVMIEQVDELNYKIIYQVTIDDTTVTENAKVHIDKVAPTISGIKDYTLEAGEMPSKGFVLEGITVSDDYSQPEQIKLSVEIEEKKDGTFALNYTAKDEAGNISTATAYVLNN